MKELVFRIDPGNLDVLEVKRFLAGYDSAMRIYEKNYESEWLLSNIHSKIWTLKTTQTTSKGDYKYKYVKNIKWDRLLPNKTRLTDQANKPFLNLIQKLLFICADSTHTGTILNPSTILSHSSALLNFISWLYLHESRFLPSRYGLSRLTEKDIENYIRQWCLGGSFMTLKTGERILSKINSVSLLNITTNDVHRLTDREVNKLIVFFEQNDFYTTANYGPRIIDRRKIQKSFNISKQEFYPHACTLFFRQFEPEVLSINDNVLLPLRLGTEHPSHKTPLISEVIDKSYSQRRISPLLNLLHDFMKLKPMFPAMLPNPDTFRLSSSRRSLKKLSAEANTTPWIPLPICLELINNSIGIIIYYGDTLLDYFDKLTTTLIKNNLYSEGARTETRNQFVKSTLPSSLRNLGIETLGKRNNWTLTDPRSNAQRLRQNPSVHEILEVLLGACLIIVAGLKPVRVNELSLLSYNCLLYKENDGFWLSHALQKSGISNILPETQKPIPHISAKAIQLLQRFNLISQKVALKINKKEAGYLLYGLTLGGAFRSASIKGPDKIKYLMSLFCDYINLKPDEFGRRWYVNTHELRKSFLLTFFWTFKFSSLDSCRWIAGHKDPDHVLRYIEANIPGEEMVDIESEYVYQQLRLFNINNEFREIDNIEKVCEEVCHHFSVNNISEVSEDDIQDWIHLAIEKGLYNIEVFGLDSHENDINVHVAFKIRDKTGEL